MKSKRNETGINKNSLWGLTSFDRENWRQTLLLPAFEVFKTYTWGRMRGNVLKLIGRGVGTGGGGQILAAHLILSQLHMGGGEQIMPTTLLIAPLGFLVIPRVLKDGRKAHSQHLSIESNDPKRKFSVNVPDYLGTTTYILLT